ncbi:MAG: diaminopimelate decarboxylase [Chromatiales bacterium]
MDVFHYRDHHLWVEEVALSDVAARFGTPAYVYSRAAIEERWRAFDEGFAALPHLICYAVKANSNLAVLNVLVRLGSGFDIVSVGELERVLRAGGDPAKVVFAGVGKRDDEIRRALEVGIRCFNVELLPELDRINRMAANLGVKAPVALRVNPDVDARTHPYVATGMKENKFGIAADEALAAYAHAAALPHLNVIGIGCHIGSQLTEVGPFEDAVAKLVDLIKRLAARGIALRHVDIGGGLGIRYRDEQPPSIGAYAQAVGALLAGHAAELLLQPGRAIVGNAGALLTRVEHIKVTGAKRFAVVDAAMNDLVRPALYNSWHEVLCERAGDDIPEVFDIVGPVCESGDFLARGRALALREGDLLAIMSAGAYGFTMSSNYNSRPRPAEVLVDGRMSRLVRHRETAADLMAGERFYED